MVEKCEVTWAGPGWNKNDDGCDSDDREDDGDDSFSFIFMGLHSVRWKWFDDHCDGDDLYDDHHGEFELGGQGRGSNSQRHQVKPKPSYSSFSCLIRTFMDGSTYHVLLFMKILGVQDKMNVIITL